MWYFSTPTSSFFAVPFLFFVLPFVVESFLFLPRGFIKSMTTTTTTSTQPAATVLETTTTLAKNESPTSPFSSSNPSLENLCSETDGAKILFATDEWFAAADNLLKRDPPVFRSDLYCEQGKVMDGWETRRRREAGHDWCIIKLAHQRARVEGIEIDTAHFTGNHVPRISLLAADLTWTQEKQLVASLPGAVDRLLHGGLQGTGHTPEEVQIADRTCHELEWKEILPKTHLNPGFEETRMHYFTLKTPLEATHLRLNYFPDGGVARFKVWGTPLPRISPRIRPPYIPIRTGPICTVVLHATVLSEEEMPSRNTAGLVELSSEALGGVGVACSNKHFGEPWRLLQLGFGRDMGDGWETARHPERPSILVKDPNTNLIDSPLMDWAILKLGQAANDGVARVILDTKHFRGNYPESVQVDGCYSTNSDDLPALQDWFPLVHRTRMAPDAEHAFDRSLHQIVNDDKPVTHVRVCIYPDGGLSRVRIYANAKSSL